MNAKRFSIQKDALLSKIDTIRQHIEQISYDDAVKCSEKYLNEEDPFEVALHDLFYQHICFTYDNSL